MRPFDRFPYFPSIDPAQPANIWSSPPSSSIATHTPLIYDSADGHSNFSLVCQILHPCCLSIRPNFTCAALCPFSAKWCFGYLCILVRCFGLFGMLADSYLWCFLCNLLGIGIVCGSSILSFCFIVRAEFVWNIEASSLRVIGNSMLRGRLSSSSIRISLPGTLRVRC